MEIVTLTLNPAVDVTYEIGHLIPDRKVHASATRFDAGGNGINVGRALKRLGVHASNFCVLAGETGQFLQRLLRKHVDDPVYEWVEKETRINCTILERDSGNQFEVSGIGPDLPKPRQDRLLDKFVATVGRGFGVVTGSVPPGVGHDVYARLIERIQGRGGRVVLDAHGDLLRQGIEAAPFLVKPNLFELGQLAGRPLGGMPEVASVARGLLHKGVECVCVSLGGEGALLVTSSVTLHALPPPVEVRSTVGAGDSMVGGLVAGFARDESLQETLKLAVACSAGTVKQPGTELFDPTDLPELIRRVEISVVE